MSKVASCICVHDDHWYLEQSIRSWAPAGPVYVFLSKLAWDRSTGDWQKSGQAAKRAGATVITGEWLSEADHRKAALEYLTQEGFTHAFIPDGDEVIEAKLLQNLLKIVEADLADRVYVHWDTYWKSAEYIIRPRERFTPLSLIKIGEVHHVHLRLFDGGRPLTLSPEHGLVHHLSYAGPDERIRRKLETWGHKDEVVPRWYERIWQGWDADKLMRNLHPTHPEAYGFAERIHIPEILRLAHVEEPNVNGQALVQKKWPKVSVVIPLHGGEEDIRLCIQGLQKCQDLLHEIIVVDDASPDGAAKVVKDFKEAKLLKHKENKGFAAACNTGLEASTGDILIFLNSDTVPTHSGLSRLIESVTASGSIGAAGPLTNASGYDQRIDPTYTSLNTLDLFAEDFANRSALDIDAPNDMLVGFCLAVKRSVLDEIGPFDEAFKIGTFEDNDLCYRIKRAGYRLVISNRAYIHHKGSATIVRAIKEPQKLLEQNRKVYENKWREDVDSGFASQLPGLAMGQVQFNREHSPERRLAKARELAKQADISLCMIARDEERVIADCLKSALPFFTQIVFVDTGSKDRTKEIAKELGAEVHEMEWPDSFSTARNESLKHAKGKWVFWMDADDTLPWNCGMELLNCALTAPPEIGAFVVPVQFVEEGPGAGTRVDHVKLFRNGRGIKFEFRIHEQNLPSINEAGLQVARSGAIVLHSGYDTSPEGQKKKRARDEKLLKLDLEEHPNHPFVLFNLGMTAHYTGEHEQAVSWLQRCLKVSQPKESHVRKAYALLAVSQRELGKTGEALSTLLKGLQVIGEDPELRFHAGILYSSTGQLEESRRQYESIQGEISGHYSSIDMSILGFKRFHNLGVVCLEMGDYAAAKENFLKALKDRPDFVASALGLLEAATKAGDWTTAQQMQGHALNYGGPTDEWCRLASELAEAQHGRGAGESFLQQATESFPKEFGPKIVLARRMCEQGRDSEAMPLLRGLENAGVPEAAFFLGVSATRRGELNDALRWMERALELNPSHQQTREQVDRLREAVAAT